MSTISQPGDKNMQGMETSWLWAIGLLSTAFGLVVGIGAGYLLGSDKKRVKQLEADFSKLQQDFGHYRDQVGDHFMQTSQLVDKMTSSYRDVYEHLARGSQELCQDPVSTPRLEIPEHDGLENKTGQKETDAAPETPAEGFSDAETDTDSQEGLDEYLGEAPQVPKLDPSYSKTTSGESATRH